MIEEWWGVAWNFIVAHSTYSGWASAAALTISGLNFHGVHRARKKTDAMAIFNLRKDALLQARLSEIEWQKVLNEMHRFKIDIEVDRDIGPETRESFLAWVSDVSEAFNNSLLDARAVSEHISKGQSSMSEREVKEYLLAFASTHAKIASNREEISKKNADLLRVAKNSAKAK